jgi:homoserine dehydrogenase
VDLRCPKEPWAQYWTKDFNDVLADPEIGVVVECIGGTHPAYDYTMAAIESGRHVVTSNKELVSTHGAEILATAKKHDVSYLFEASVGGGIPLLGPIARFLSHEDITGVYGILNGTTNFIMTRMEEDGIPFADAVALAQKNGYAEADPTADIEGIDACRKTAILASMLTKKTVLPQDIVTEGITKLTAEDAAAANAAGFALKLVCRITKNGERVGACVTPALVPRACPLFGVRDVFNGVLITGAHLGDTFFYGRGAGKLPTASAVVSDVVEAIDHKGHIPYFDWSEERAEIDDATLDEAYWILRAAPEDVNALDDIFALRRRFTSGGEAVVITPAMTKPKFDALAEKAAARGVKIRSVLHVNSK